MFNMWNMFWITGSLRYFVMCWKSMTNPWQTVSCKPLETSLNSPRTTGQICFSVLVQSCTAMVLLLKLKIIRLASLDFWCLQWFRKIDWWKSSHPTPCSCIGWTFAESEKVSRCLASNMKLIGNMKLRDDQTNLQLRLIIPKNEQYLHPYLCINIRVIFSVHMWSVGSSRRRMAVLSKMLCSWLWQLKWMLSNSWIPSHQ